MMSVIPGLEEENDEKIHYREQGVGSDLHSSIDFYYVYRKGQAVVWLEECTTTELP